MTLEQLLPVFSKVVPKFCNFKYEYNELVNAVWEMGRVQKLTDIRLAYGRIYYDCIDYIRVCEGRETAGIKTKQKKVRITNFSALDYDDEDSNIEGILQSRKSFGKVIGTLDEKVWLIDMVEYLIKGLEVKHRIIFRLCLAGLTNKQIGEHVGYSESRISHILKFIRATIKQRLLKTERKANGEYCESAESKILRFLKTMQPELKKRWDEIEGK